MQRQSGLGEENVPPAGALCAPSSTPRGLQARAALQPASQSAQNVVVTSKAWKTLAPAATPAAPRARPAAVSPDAPLPRDHDRQHGGGGGSCHQCRHSSYVKLGEPGVLVSAKCRGSKTGKKHAFHRGCMRLKYPEQLASGDCPACTSVCCGDRCAVVLCLAGKRKPGCKLQLNVHLAADAASESEVNTPAAFAAPFTSPLLVPRPHMAHMRPAALAGDTFLEQSFRSPAFVQQNAWTDASLDFMDDGLHAIDLLFEPELLNMPESLRRGSLPEVLPRAVWAVASPGAVRHALPMRLFGESS